MDVWPWTIEARRSLLENFEGLDDDQWATPSLCAGWSVREVLAHLILAVRPPKRRYAVALARAGGNFDKGNHALAVADATQPVGDLIAAYRAVVDHRFSPPGWPQAAPLSDILIHSLDVRLALGLPNDEHPERYEPAMRLLFSLAGRSFSKTKRPKLTWVATDREWSGGSGPRVEGALADLALAAAGRGARLDHLSGAGVQALRSWLV